MLLSIIVPVYNEEKTVGLTLERLFVVDLGETRKEIIVVNDGSTDMTAKTLKPLLGRVRYLEHPHNRGKGAAIRTGLAAATGDAVIVQDADLEYSPEDIPRLIASLEMCPELVAVYGSRNLSPTGRGYSHYILGAWALTKAVNLCFNSRLTDVYTCYKLVRTEVLRSLCLRQNGFEIEMEITAKLLTQGLRIAEAPISYRPRTWSEGKKIRARDGIKGLLLLWRIALRNRTLSPERGAV